MNNLFDPPPCFGLPLSHFGGLSADFENNPSDDGVTFVDYDVGSVVTLVIGTVADPLVQAVAVVTGHHAVVTITPQDLEPVPAKTPWTLTVETPESVVPVVAAEGTVWWTNG